jgi:hypothetical protein
MKISPAYANYEYNPERLRIALNGITAFQVILGAKYL